jgi:hypothetical protein
MTGTTHATRWRTSRNSVTSTSANKMAPPAHRFSQFGAKLYTWPSLVAVTTRRSWPIETPTGYPVASGSE